LSQVEKFFFRKKKQNENQSNIICIFAY